MLLLFLRTNSRTHGCLLAVEVKWPQVFLIYPDFTDQRHSLNCFLYYLRDFLCKWFLSLVTCETYSFFRVIFTTVSVACFFYFICLSFGHHLWTFLAFNCTIFVQSWIFSPPVPPFNPGLLSLGLLKAFFGGSWVCRMSSLVQADFRQVELMTPTSLCPAIKDLGGLRWLLKGSLWTKCSLFTFPSLLP